MKSFKVLLLFAVGSLFSFAGYSQEIPVKSPVVNELLHSTIDQQMDENLKTIMPKANSGRHYIPVIGTYQNSAEGAAQKNVSITVDEQNPGKIWISGLSSEKIYAVLKFYPGVYKIPSQEGVTDKLPEGTLLYDDSNKQINIFLGGGYNDTNPVGPATIFEQAVVGNKKTSSKEMQLLSFIGSKTETSTAAK